MPPNPLPKLRKICLALPEAHEAMSWGAPTFRVRNKLFAMFAAHGNHHHDGRPGVWCNCTPVNQDLLIQADPSRFFKPPYVGPGGWVGVYLDGEIDWAMVADVLADAYTLTTEKLPKRNRPEIGAKRVAVPKSPKPPAAKKVKVAKASKVAKRPARKTVKRPASRARKPKGAR